MAGMLCGFMELHMAKCIKGKPPFLKGECYQIIYDSKDPSTQDFQNLFIRAIQ